MSEISLDYKKSLLIAMILITCSWTFKLPDYNSKYLVKFCKLIKHIQYYFENPLVY